MGSEKERDFVAGLYPGQKWKDKVKKMPDAQVLAIYLRKKQGEQTLEKESPPDVEPF